MNSVVQLIETLRVNSPAAWMLATALFLGTAGFLFGGRILLARRGAKLASRTTTQVDDVIVAVLSATNVVFIAVVALQAGSSALTLPSTAASIIRIATAIAVAIQVGLWGSAAIRAITRGYVHRHPDGATRTAVFAVGFLAQTVLWAFVLIAALTSFGYDVTALVAGLGIGGIALALAVQNILGDLFAAVSIVVDKPFVVGETIDVDGQVGMVERIGLKTTRVRALQGEEVVYSNADLLKVRLRNYARMRERRIVMSVGVTYETPLATIARVPNMIREAIQAQPNVRFDRAHLARLAESSYEFEFVFYALDPDFNIGMDLRQAIYLALLRRFELERVPLAYPTRSVILRSESPAATAPPPSAGASQRT
jgi:small-conductance mechanosensitive channel